MGVILRCIDEECSFSYIAFQEIRIDIIRATLKYVENHREELIQYYRDNCIYYDDDDEWKEHREKYAKEQLYRATEYLKDLVQNNSTRSIDSHISLFSIFNNTPNYKAFNKSDDDILKSFGLYGIVPIINHSDCEGYYSVGEAIDFMNVLSKTYMYFDKYKYFFDEDILLENHYMYPLFKKSMDEKKPIRLS